MGLTDTPTATSVNSRSPTVCKSSHSPTVCKSPHSATVCKSPHSANVCKSPHSATVCKSPHSPTVCKSPHSAKNRVEVTSLSKLFYDISNPKQTLNYKIYKVFVCMQGERFSHDRDLVQIMQNIPYQFQYILPYIHFIKVS